MSTNEHNPVCSTARAVCLVALLGAGCQVQLLVGDGCEPGESVCDVDGRAQCVNTAAAREHCGACGVECSGSCRDGACCPRNLPGVCPEGGDRTSCVDRATDPRHCGACGEECTNGVCISGRCCESASAAACEIGADRSCVDLASDAMHCGSCGVRCASGLCVDGECCEGNAPGICSDRCVDLSSDPSSCGACDRSCVDGLCSAGLCCAETGGTVCRDATGAAACVDPQTDRDNCGECGSACLSGICDGGACCDQVCGEACVPNRHDRLESWGGHEGLSARLVDVDGDGFDDALWNMQLDEWIEIHWGNAVGLSTAAILETGRIGVGLDVGDVDGDGHLDIVASIQAEGPPAATEIRVFFGDGARGFPRTAIVTQDFNPGWLALLDADGDGHLDIVVRLMGASCTALRRGDGAGVFSDAECLFPYGTLSDNEALRAGDVDGDGLVELIEYRLVPGPEIRIHDLEDGRVVTSERLPVTSVTTPHLFDLHDVNGDGVEDIVLFEPSGATTLVRGFRPDGDCLVATLVTTPPPRVEFIYTAGDFDADGNVDFAGRHTCGYCVSLKTLHLGRR